MNVNKKLNFSSQNIFQNMQKVKTNTKETTVMNMKQMTMTMKKMMTMNMKKTTTMNEIMTLKIF